MRYAEKMANDGDTHQFLRIGKYHRNEDAAEKFVLDLLRPHFPDVGRSQLRTRTFKLDCGKGPFYQTFEELKRQARETGTVQHRRLLVGDDQFFPQTLNIAASSSGGASGMKVKASYAGHTAEFQAPMRVFAVEDELCNDILSWRRATCSSSHFPFDGCTRSYRAYVLACTSLVEAFLNRVPLLFRHLREHVDAIERLYKPMNFEERIDLWVGTFCVEPVAALKATKAWNHFQELREERNRLVHALEPQLGVAIQKLPHRLNLVRDGVGGFMRKLRTMQGLGPTSFIEQLETAPQVGFHPSRTKPSPTQVDP